MWGELVLLQEEGKHYPLAPMVIDLDVSKAIHYIGRMPSPLASAAYASTHTHRSQHVIPFGFISAVHCSIIFDSDGPDMPRYYVQDHSTNGTFIRRKATEAIEDLQSQLVLIGANNKVEIFEGDFLVFKTASPNVTLMYRFSVREVEPVITVKKGPNSIGLASKESAISGNCGGRSSVITVTAHGTALQGQIEIFQKETTKLASQLQESNAKLEAADRQLSAALLTLNALKSRLGDKESEVERLNESLSTFSSQLAAVEAHNHKLKEQVTEMKSQTSSLESLKAQLKLKSEQFESRDKMVMEANKVSAEELLRRMDVEEQLRQTRGEFRVAKREAEALHRTILEMGQGTVRKIHDIDEMKKRNQELSQAVEKIASLEEENLRCRQNALISILRPVQDFMQVIAGDSLVLAGIADLRNKLEEVGVTGDQDNLITHAHVSSSEGCFEGSGGHRDDLVTTIGIRMSVDRCDDNNNEQTMHTQIVRLHSEPAQSPTPLKARPDTLFHSISGAQSSSSPSRAPETDRRGQQQQQQQDGKAREPPTGSCDSSNSSATKSRQSSPNEPIVLEEKSNHLSDLRPAAAEADDKRILAAGDDHSVSHSTASSATDSNSCSANSANERALSTLSELRKVASCSGSGPSSSPSSDVGLYGGGGLGPPTRGGLIISTEISRKRRRPVRYATASQRSAANEDEVEESLAERESGEDTFHQSMNLVATEPSSLSRSGSGGVSSSCLSLKQSQEASPSRGYSSSLDNKQDGNSEGQTQRQKETQGQHEEQPTELQQQWHTGNRSGSSTSSSQKKPRGGDPPQSSPLAASFSLPTRLPSSPSPQLNDSNGGGLGLTGKAKTLTPTSSSTSTTKSKAVLSAKSNVKYNANTSKVSASSNGYGGSPDTTTAFRKRTRNQIKNDSEHVLASLPK